MTNEKKIFTLEHVKLSSMGPDTIVYIPRALIKHKVLRWRCGTGNTEYIIPRSYNEEQIYFQREIVIKAFQLIHKVEEGKEWDYLIDKTHKKVLDTFFPIYETIRRHVLDGAIEPLRTCPTCYNVTIEKICPLCGGNTY